MDNIVTFQLKDGILYFKITTSEDVFEGAITKYPLGIEPDKIILNTVVHEFIENTVVFKIKMDDCDVLLKAPVKCTLKTPKVWTILDQRTIEQIIKRKPLRNKCKKISSDTCEQKCIADRLFSISMPVIENARWIRAKFMLVRNDRVCNDNHYRYVDDMWMMGYDEPHYIVTIHCGTHEFKLNSWNSIEWLSLNAGKITVTITRPKGTKKSINCPIDEEFMVIFDRVI